MASEVDICNSALGHLGDEANITAITPPDGSAQAGHCSRWYPISRDEVLERHTWRFNTQRVTLALSSLAAPTGWAFAYAAPNLMLKPIAIIAPSALPDFISWWQGINNNDMQVSTSLLDTLNSQDYVMEMNPADGTPVVYTNVEAAIMIYSVGITDTTKMPPLFRAAIARLLASKLAGPIIKGKTGADVAKEQLAIYEKMDLPLAMVSDANARQNNPYTTAMPAPIAARQ
jgi:hypothetical protein